MMLSLSGSRCATTTFHRALTTGVFFVPRPTLIGLVLDTGYARLAAYVTSACFYNFQFGCNPQGVVYRTV